MVLAFLYSNVELVLEAFLALLAVTSSTAGSVVIILENHFKFVNFLGSSNIMTL
jgi:hypothetical protein